MTRGAKISNPQDIMEFPKDALCELICAEIAAMNCKSCKNVVYVVNRFNSTARIALKQRKSSFTQIAQ